MNIHKYQRRSGFTLLELLIVIGIVAIVGTIVVMILNPSDLFKQGRDTKRMTDLKAIDTAIRAYKEYGDIFKTPSIVQSDPSNAVIGLVRQDCTGYSNCFTSLAAWQTAFGGINFGAYAPGDLVSANKVAVAKIDGTWTNLDTTPVTIGGWVTGPNNYIKIYTTPTARHKGIPDTGYRLSVTYNHGILIYAAFVKIEGVSFEVDGSNPNDLVGIRYVNSSNNRIEISNSIFRDKYPASTGISIGQSGDTTNKNVYIWNNIIYNFGNGEGIVSETNPNGVAYLYNNTIVNSKWGITVLTGNKVVAKNNISYNNVTDYSGNFESSSTNNISKDATSPNINFRNKTVSFVSTSSSDFHLSPFDTSARSAGADLSVDPNLAFNNDIDGLWRFNIWDIGADQLQDIFVSLPDSSTVCANLSLPVSPSGWSYRCSASSTLTKTNGTGWIPVDFTRIPGNTLSSLPVDPNNLSASGQYYTFVTDGKKWELTSILESDKNKGASNVGGKDGGQNDNILEIGSNLTLTPLSVKSRQ